MPEQKKEHIYLGTTNAQLEHCLGNQQYTDFSSLMRDMRKDQWGWRDFINLFSLVNKVAVVNFQQGSRFVYNRHRSLARIKETLFLVNVQDAIGMCNHNIMMSPILSRKPHPLQPPDT